MPKTDLNLNIVAFGIREWTCNGFSESLESTSWVLDINVYTVDCRDLLHMTSEVYIQIGSIHPTHSTVDEYPRIVI